jgi:hypothetical protein
VFNSWHNFQLLNQKTGGPLGEFFVFQALLSALRMIKNVQVYNTSSDKEASKLLSENQFDMIYIEKNWFTKYKKLYCKREAQV